MIESQDDRMNREMTVSVGDVKMVFNGILRFSTVFSGKVSLKGYLKNFKSPSAYAQASRKIPRSISPKHLPCRMLPFHLVKATDHEIDNLLANDIWESVERPASWVSPLVVAPKFKKPNEVRITVDAREANKALVRVKYQMPTTEELAGSA